MIILYEKNIFTKYFSHSQKRKKKGRKTQCLPPDNSKSVCFSITLQAAEEQAGLELPSRQEYPTPSLP